MVSIEAVILTILTALTTIIVSIIGYFLKQTMNDLKDTKDLAFRTKSELEVLKTDHVNKHESMSDKFDDLKDSIIILTKEIKELTAKIK
jgi:hypothetical protein